MKTGATEAGSKWSGRHRARAAALQALYECEVGGLTPQQALGVLHHAGPPEVNDPGESEHAFVIALVQGAMSDKDRLDERIGEAAKNWRIERMAMIDRLVTKRKNSLMAFNLRFFIFYVLTFHIIL